MAEEVGPTFRGTSARAADLDVPHVSNLSESRGWQSYMPGNEAGELPWRLRWLGVPLLLCLCTLSGWWSWDHMEDQLDVRALAHLECENIDTTDMALDWSYRDVTVDGQLPSGVTANQVEQVLDNGSTNAACLANAGIDSDDDPGIYDVKVLAAAGTAAAAGFDDEPDAAAPTVAPEPTEASAEEPAEAPAEEPASEDTVQSASLDARAAFDGETITLAGTVASDAQRQTLIDVAARTVGAENVIDELEVADGEPTEGSDERAAELATLVSQFDASVVTEGRASANDQALTYALLAPTSEARDGLVLPGSGTIEVRPSADGSADADATDASDSDDAGDAASDADDADDAASDADDADDAADSASDDGDGSDAADDEEVDDSDLEFTG